MCGAARNVTSYNAWYIAAAEAFELPLATLDQRLSRASGPSCRFRLPARRLRFAAALRVRSDRPATRFARYSPLAERHASVPRGRDRRAGTSDTRALVAAGHRVRGVARGPAKADVVRADGGEPIEVSLFDAHALLAALQGCDAVLHFATKIPPIGRITRRNAAENDRLRREASRCLVDAALAAGIATYVQESIAFLYADGGDAWLDEDAPLLTSWLNDSALAAERETARFARGGGRGVALRFGVFYAPYARSTIDTARLARRGLFPVLGTGYQFMSSIHVDDAATAAVAALGVASGVYNVVDDEPLRFREYVEAVGAGVGVAQRLRLPAWLVKAIFGEASHVFLVSRRVSNRRFRTAAGWRPQAASARQHLPAVVREIAAANATATSARRGRRRRNARCRPPGGTPPRSLCRSFQLADRRAG